MMKLLNRKKVFFGIIAALLSSFCVFGVVFAAVPTSFSTEAQNNALINARNKVMYSIISDCYNSLSDEINVTSGYVTWSQIFNNGNAKHDMPYYLFNGSTVSSSKKLTCSEIMGGWKNFWGTQTFPGVGYREGDIPVPDNNGNYGTKEEMVAFLEKIGYAPTEGSASEVEGYRCVSYSGTTPSGKIYATDKLCAKQSNDSEDQIDLDYVIKIDDVSSDDLGAGNLDTMIFKIKEASYSGGTLTIPKVGYDSWVFVAGATHAQTDNYASCTTTYVSTPIQWSSGGSGSGVTYELCYSYGVFGLSTGRLRISGINSMTFDDLARSLGSALMTAKEAEPDNFPSFSSQEAMVDSATIDSAIATVLEKGSFDDYMKYFMGTNYAQYGGELTETEKYMLYWSGLKEVVTANSGAPNGNVEYWLVGTEFKDDYNLICSSGCDITTLNRDGKMKTLKAISGSNPTVLQLLNELDYNSDDFGKVTVPEEDIYNDTTPSEGSTSETETTCGNSGGAASLGWIVCPVLEWTGKASEKIYTDYVEPSLQIEPKLFSTNSDEGTRKAWGIFQNIANFAFVILFLAVIFSQLTGVGIDNYGIKKILPKLIIVAVLVNLSYYICLVFVDISNIVGNGVQALFSGLDVGTPSLNIPDSTAKLEATSTAITGVAVLAAMAGMVGLIWTNPAILLSLLVSALGVVIAIFFLFLLLAAREAAIVVLVVISPLAFVCYMLPNTKKFFDRWLKLGQGLLLVYPIAGLLVGGGDFVSRLLLSSGFASNGVFAAFSAMIVGIVPIFFIPTVLKSSFAAMGNLGAKISGIGDRVRGGVDKRIRNADAYKNAQERGMERRTRIRAGLDKDGNPIETGKLGRFMRGGKRSMAKARAQYLKNQDTNKRVESLNGIGFQAAVIGQQKRAEKDELADYMTLINNETRNGENTDKLYEMFDEYMEAGDKAGAVAVARIAGRRKDTADDFLSKKITGQSIDKKTGKETLADVTKGYDRKLFASVMKEIATGESSGNYRSSAPLGFEFAAQFNREYREGVDGAGEMSYGAWRSATKTDDSGNIIRNVNTDRSMGNYVTNSSELVGTKNSSLREINKLISDGAISETEAGRLRRLASETIDNRSQTGIWDTTKAEQIYRLAGRSAEYDAMVSGAAGDVRGENAAAQAGSSGFDVRAQAAAQARPEPHQAPQAQPMGAPVRQQTMAGQAIDVRALGDETLLDIATNPNAQNNDATRTAAEQEYLRRNPGFNGGGSNGSQNPPENPLQQG